VAAYPDNVEYTAVTLLRFWVYCSLSDEDVLLTAIHAVVPMEITAITRQNETSRKRNPVT
jgi:hypothetical protein